MIRFLIAMLMVSNLAWAGISVCEDQNGVITHTQLRGNSIPGCFYYDSGQNVTKSGYDLIKTTLQQVPRRYLKIVNAVPVEMAPEEKVAVDDALAMEITANLKASAKIALTQESPEMKAMRNAFRVVMASLIETRTKLNALIADQGSSLEPLPNRSWAQVLTATRNQIDAESDPST